MTTDLLIHGIREIMVSRKVETLEIEQNEIKVSYVRKIFLKDINGNKFQISMFSNVKECLEVKYQVSKELI